MVPNSCKITDIEYMENLGDINQMGLVFLLFVTSGVIIYATSTWIGEALLTQIRTNRTSVFGRSEEYSKAKSRTIYVPPAQVNTLHVKTTQPAMVASTPKPILPVIPSRPPVNRY